MKRALLLCAGRGSYTEKTLRSLPAEHEFVARAEALRREFGLASLLALDRAERFAAAEHLAPANASALIWLVSMIDAQRAASEHALVAVGGNSMGWYTALAVAGALEFEDGFRLVQRMALLQQAEQARSGGGQVLYPLVGEDWRRDAARAAAVEHALVASRGHAFRSIELGGFAVLAGDEEGVAQLLQALPKLKLGANPYPFRLIQHGPYHTPLARPVAEAARAELGALRFRRPRVTLIDGLGRRHTPWSADPERLREYTLGAQVSEPYDFAASVRVGLREHAPERIVLPGPGNTLGGVVGQCLVDEGWRGIRSKADFEAVQSSSEPIVVSMRR